MDQQDFLWQIAYSPNHHINGFAWYSVWPFNEKTPTCHQCFFTLGCIINPLRQDARLGFLSRWIDRCSSTVTVVVCLRCEQITIISYHNSFRPCTNVRSSLFKMLAISMGRPSALMTFQSVDSNDNARIRRSLAFQPHRAGSEVAGWQAGRQDVWQHAKSSTAVHFAEDRSSPLSHPQSRGAVSPLYAGCCCWLTHCVQVATNRLWWMMSKSAGRSILPFELFPLQIQNQNMWREERGDKSGKVLKRRLEALHKSGKVLEVDHYGNHSP